MTEYRPRDRQRVWEVPTTMLLGDAAAYYRVGGKAREAVEEHLVAVLPGDWKVRLRVRLMLRVCGWIVGRSRLGFGYLATCLELRRRIGTEEW
jgi:hypothetical protein